MLIYPTSPEDEGEPGLSLGTDGGFASIEFLPLHGGHSMPARTICDVCRRANCKQTRNGGETDSIRRTRCRR